MNDENKMTPDQEAASNETDQDTTAVNSDAEPESQILAEMEHETAKATQVQADAAARIEELEAEVATLKDKLLRAMAETENVRRRAERSRKDASNYAIANFARDMVVVYDNLSRALESVDAETRKNDEALEQICVGIEMTNRAMIAAFERVNIKPIVAMGQPFDHNFHEAMFELEDVTQPVGTVVHQMETGFTIGERLLRPSKVGVSKGGPKKAANGNGTASKAAGEPANDQESKASQAYEASSGAPGATVDEEL